MLVFQGDRVLEAPPLGLKPTDANHLEAVTDWMGTGEGSIRAAGRSDPAAALRRAALLGGG